MHAWLDWEWDLLFFSVYTLITTLHNYRHFQDVKVYPGKIRDAEENVKVLETD